MYPYLKEDGDEEEFYKIMDIAVRLFSNRKNTRQLAEKELIQYGVKAVRPIMCTIEYAMSDDNLSDSDIDNRADIVSEVIVKIGKDSLPDLEDFVLNGSCNIFVNDCAQEMIFQVMGLEGAEKQKVCHHSERTLVEQDNKKVWVCFSCDAEFDD